jgi:NTE family protein
MIDDGPAAPDSTALVLSGAGTKGAFEVGALAHLIVEQGLNPDIITATSAGAILGTVLAQARTPDEFTARVGDLRADLLAMTSTDLVFAKQPWLAEFDGEPLGDAVDAFLTVRNRPPVPADPDVPAPAPAAGAGAAAGDHANTDSNADGDTPFDEDAPPVRRRHHRWHALTSVLEALPAAHRAKGKLAGHVGSLLTLDPLENAFRGRGDSGITPIDPALVARPGLQLRLTVTALAAGETRYITEDGSIVAADARTPAPGTAPRQTDVINGLLASSSVPMVFEPRPIGDDVYVDGGVLQNIPVRAAVELGAQHIVAVLGVPLAAPRDTRDFTTVNFVGIFLRSTSQIGFYDRQRTNLATPRPEGVSLLVIEPTLDVVGPFEVAQGLMLLDMDYGWMRAAEATAGLDDDTLARAMAATDAATAARERAWYSEESLWAASEVTAADLDALRAIKRQVQRAMATRHDLGLAPPPGVETWWQSYEAHPDERPPSLPADLWAGAREPLSTEPQG